MPYVAKMLGIGGAAIALFIAVALAINTALVALIWNTANLHGAVGAGTLSFWQCVGCGLALMIVGL
jgi:hypothetical protein